MTLPKSYSEIMNEAVKLNEEKNRIGTQIIRQIGPLKSKYAPNNGVGAIAKSWILTATQLSGQIIDAARLGHLVIAIIGLRTLFEISVNTKYIYDHPKHKKDFKHMRRICKSVIKLANKKRRVNHTRIDGISFETRAKDVKLTNLYKKAYKILSDWAHLALRTIYLTNQAKGEMVGVNIASLSLCMAHDVLDSISEAYGFSLDPTWCKAVIDFRDAYEQPVAW